MDPKWLVVLAACASPPIELQRDLELVGPVRVTVDSLGVVTPPEVRWSDGVPASDLVWTVSPSAVASIEDGTLSADAPGEVVVLGSLDGQQVQFTLVVEPHVSLHLDDPPTLLAVGDAARIGVRPQVGGSDVEVELAWRSSDPALATVEPDGTVRGHSPGLVYITVDAGRAQAMVELEVR